MHKISPSAAFEEPETKDLPPSDNNLDKETLPKTRSCENLVAMSGGSEHTLTSSGRRLSDPNIKMNSSSILGSLNVEEEAKGIVINSDCVTFCKQNRDNDTTLVAGENKMDQGESINNSSNKDIVNNSKATETSDGSLENSIININEEDEELEVNQAECDKNLQGKAYNSTIPSQDTLEGCDKTPQCSSHTNDLNVSHTIPSADSEACVKQEEEVVAETRRDSGDSENQVVTAEEAHQQVVVKQPGSAVVFTRDQSERVITTINGSISDTAALLPTRSQKAPMVSGIDNTDDQCVEASPTYSGSSASSATVKSPQSEDLESRDIFPGQGTTMSPPRDGATGSGRQKVSLIQARASNMSTSTSDISDSHVHIDFKSKLTGKPSAVKVSGCYSALEFLQFVK